MLWQIRLHEVVNMSRRKSSRNFPLPLNSCPVLYLKPPTEASRQMQKLAEQKSAGCLAKQDAF